PRRTDGRRATRPARGSCRLPFANELLNTGDDVVDLEVRRVDLHGVCCGAEPRRVALVAATKIGDQRVPADVRTLCLTSTCANSGVRVEIDLHFGGRLDDRADVAPLDDDVTVCAELPLPLAHDLADSGVCCDHWNLSVDTGLANRGRHIGGGDPHAFVVVERHGVLHREARELVGAVERNAPVHREPRERAIHRAGVEVAEAESLGEPPRDRALSCPPGPVDGNDHRRETDSKRSKNPGKLIAPASSPPTSTPSRETSPATAQSIAMRWSPSELIRPPFGREGTPRTPKPSSLARMRTPKARSAFVTLSIRSVSLTRSSPAPWTRLSPRANAAASAKSGSSS